MAVIQLSDGNGTLYYFEVSGTGTADDPFIPLSNLSVAGAMVADDNPAPVTDAALTMINRMILDALQSPAAYDSTQQRVRGSAIIESGTVSTVSTVGNMSQLDSRPGAMLINAMDDLAWNAMVGSKIT